MLTPEQSRTDAELTVHRGGLVLSWPAIARELTSDFVIDIRNEGETRWMPDGESFHVVGTVSEPGATDLAIGWASSSQNRAVPLEPGDYTRVPVQIPPGTWTTIEAGDHEVHAVLVGLGIRPATPLAVHLTVEQVAAIRARALAARPDPAVRRRMLDGEVHRLRAITAARASLASIASVIGSAESDDEAVDRLASILECDSGAARAVLHSPLSDLAGFMKSRIDERLADAERRQEGDGGQAAAPS